MKYPNFFLWLGLAVIIVAILATQIMKKPIATPGPMANNSPSLVPTATANPMPRISGWKTITDSASGVRLQYPPALGTTYISTVDWPPKAQASTQPFTCTPIGSLLSQNGQTTSQVINNHPYCLTQKTEGAAGSQYRQYTYAFPKDSKVITLAFTLRFGQCANYEQPRQQACSIEQSSFDITSIVDQIAQSTVLP